MLAAPLQPFYTCLLATGAHAQDPTTEQGEAAVTNPSAEYTPYYYPPVAAAVATGQFPPIRTGVTSLPSNGTEAHMRFLAVNGSVVAINLKGILAGTFSNLTAGYPLSDPDFLWTFHHLATPKLTGGCGGRV